METDMNRMLAERVLPQGEARKATRRPGRNVTVNLAESPLGWLRARSLISARQLDAGEKLRADWEQAGYGPKVTMEWGQPARDKASRRAPPPLHPTVRQTAARRRVRGLAPRSAEAEIAGVDLVELHALQQDRVARSPTDQHVIADLGQREVSEIVDAGDAVEKDRVLVLLEVGDAVVAIAGAEAEQVVAFAARQHVVAAAAPERVVALAAIEHVVPAGFRGR